jgi:uncharacterized membrane protein
MACIFNLKKSLLHYFPAKLAMSTLLRLRAVAGGIRAAKWTASLHTTAAASGWQSEQRQTKAVIFDMGGVIIPSPMPFIMGNHMLFSMDVLLEKS